MLGKQYVPIFVPLGVFAVVTASCGSLMRLIFPRQAWTLLPELCKKAGQYDLGLLFLGQGVFFLQVKMKFEF